MNPSIATAIFVVGIAGLFVLDRDRNIRTSAALWLPVIWLCIVGSRELSRWLSAFGFGGGGDLSDQSLEGNPFDRNIYMLLLFVGIIVLVNRGAKVRTLVKANGPILLFFTYCALSVLWSDFPELAFKRWIKALGDVVMLFIVLSEYDRIGAVKRLFARVAFLLIPLSVLLIIWYPRLAVQHKLSGKAVYTGVATTKNLLGVTCLLFGLASEWRFLLALKEPPGKQRTRQLLVNGVILAMTMWLFWRANSLTALACFMLAGGMLFVIESTKFPRNTSMVHLLVLCVVLASFSVLFLGYGSSSLESMGRDATLTGRVDLWKLVLSLAGNPMLGTGFESYWVGWRQSKIWSVYWWHPNEAHNGYLEVFVNLGWVGVTLLTVLLVTGYRNCIAAFRQGTGLSSLKLAFFTVGVVYNFTEAGFRMMDPIWITFLLAAMVIPEPRVYRVPEFAMSPSGRYAQYQN